MEVCCGGASLSRAFLDSGFQVLSVDHIVLPEAKAPVTVLDLTCQPHQTILLDIVASHTPDYLHFGLPCGTASRARDKPVAQSLQRMGAPNPPQLRSAQFPLGNPDIPADSINGIRLTKANALYQFALQLLLLVMGTQCVVSFENPARSWFWAAMTALVLKWHKPSLTTFWSSLRDVEFDTCCHGGSRKKLTRWKSTQGIFDTLQKFCSGDHEHEPYQVRWNGSHWTFDTASEAAYPSTLCRTVAEILKSHVTALGKSLCHPQPLRHLTLAMQHRQHRRRQALIPEYISTRLQPLTQPLQDLEVWIPSSKGGIDQKESREGMGKVGKFHSPEEFANKAARVEHPMDNNAVATETQEAVRAMAKKDLKLVVLEMKTKLLKAQILARTLQQEEMQEKEKMDPSVRKVVRKKNLLLFEKLLNMTGYKDMGCMSFLRKGVPIVGSHDHPDNYSWKLKPAAITENELRQSAIWRRKALLARRPQTEEPGFLEHLVETAKEEVELGFLEGPFHEEQEISKIFGHDQWSVMRRFVIQQGAKLRPIDDGLEAQVNKAYTSTIDLELQDLDYITALALTLGDHPGRRWVGKCLDLSKAYKQLPLLPAHQELAVVYFKGPNERHNFFVPNSLMFGATAAVFGFNRTSKALWYLLSRYLLIPTAVYFDDFVLFVPEEISTEVDAIASSFLHLLGWDHNLTGQKGQPFKVSFDVLGATLDLSDLQNGKLGLRNKEGRLEKILKKLDEIQQRQSMTLQEAQELHGLLNFASGFYLGRGLKTFCFKIFDLVKGRTKRSLDAWCRDLRTALVESPPRIIDVRSSDQSILVFTDGSVIIDEANSFRLVIEDVVSPDLLAVWKDIVGEQLICQIELLAVVLTRWELIDHMAGRRVLLFIDNDAARAAILKGTSKSISMFSLVEAFYGAENQKPSYWWTERVPSSSNPGDEPSRGKGREAAIRWNAHFQDGFKCSRRLVTWLKKFLKEQSDG